MRSPIMNFKRFKAKRLAAAVVLPIALAQFLAIAALAQVGPLAPTASDVDRNVSTALRNLYSHNEAAKALGARAKAILVFPDIRKGAFVIGAQYGFGALRQRGRTVGYYRTAAASYGFQAGVKKFGYALFFMTNSAVAYLDKRGGFGHAHPPGSA